MVFEILRVFSSGEWVINKLEKYTCHNGKRYVKTFPLKPEHYLSHNCNFWEIQLKDLSRLLADKSLIRE